MGIRLSSGHRALRRGRWSQSGQIYLLTSTTLHRRPWFAVEAAAQAACRSFAAFDDEGTSRLVAWVLMPDHAHWLLQLGEGESLPQAVNRLKAGSARRINRCVPRARIWARGFHDRAIRADEDLVDAARYIVANPIRAGLANRVGDYPYWNCIYL